MSDLMGTDREWRNAILTFVGLILLVGFGIGACVNHACSSGWRLQSPVTRGARR